MDHFSPGGKTRTLDSGDSVATGATRRLKPCCVCGEDLVGKPRLKDHEGRYWCPTCAKDDDLRKQPAACSECQQQLTRGDLVEHEGRLVCKTCEDKLRMAARRAAARIKAAEEEARKQHEHRRMTAIIAITIAAVLAIFGILYWVLVRAH